MTVRSERCGRAFRPDAFRSDTATQHQAPKNRPFPLPEKGGPIGCAALRRDHSSGGVTFLASLPKSPSADAAR
ncbi:hypothetical protein [Lysobacter gummosus]|uniref:hypothetical protein n=1 Tax=Lysobacter gummosus TaxID=262324 RepID=UPI00363F2607